MMVVPERGDIMQDIANFLFEVGMLKRTPRTGHQFLGSGDESVAEHLCRVVYIGYALAQLAGDVDETTVLKMCFLHDLHEARTGDLNLIMGKPPALPEDSQSLTNPGVERSIQGTGEAEREQDRRREPIA